MKKHVDLKKIHQESPKRIQAIFDRLEADGLLNRSFIYIIKLVLLKKVITKLFLLRKLKLLIAVHFRCSVFGSEDAKLPQIMLAHSEDHIRRIIKGNITGTGMYFEKGSMEAILLAAGGAIKV